jgi:biotin operon repressor
MATAEETLKAILSETEFGAMRVLSESTVPLSGRKVATALGVSPTTANKALSTLLEAGFATSRKSGRATLWQLAVSNPSISAWLAEAVRVERAPSTGSSPYSTGGGGVRLEHSYTACLIAGLLAGNALPELGDAIPVDSIRLQASDLSDADDIVIEGRDAHGQRHRASIAVRRSPLLTASDDASVPLVRDFLAIVTDQWAEVCSGRWQLGLAVSTNANAVTQLAELAELARSLPTSAELVARLSQAGRTNLAVRGRYDHLKGLVERASKVLPSADGLTAEELTWRLLSHLSTRNLRLERTDRADRTAAVNALQRVLVDGTPAAADALFSRLEELVGEWAPQGAVLTQALVRRRLSDYQLNWSAPFAPAWGLFDRLRTRLRESIRPALRSGQQALELERPGERSRLVDAMRSVGESAGALVVTGDPDVGKSALSLRAVEALEEDGAAIVSLSLRDLPVTVMDLEAQLGARSVDEVMGAGAVGPVRLLLVDGAEAVLEGKGQVFRAIVAAGLRAGFGVVSVARTDGSRQVGEEMARALELAGSSLSPGEHTVGPLTNDERHALIKAFTVLTRLSVDARTSWVLGRPGLVDALLRTGTALDPGDLLCEADVYSAVWRSLIRRDEIHPPGAASPDDRDQAALRVARQTLGIAADPPHGTGAAELRSDGVLRVPINPAIAPGDEFATDLFRDFALCRLFITQGWDVLSSAGAPRWSIRAARLGCQAALLAANRVDAWVKLSARLGEIASAQGDRWLEVPYEALLTLGDAEAALREMWGTMTANDSAGLGILLRLAEARYVHGTIGDAFALAPLVKVAFCERPKIERGPQFGHRTVYEMIRDLVLAWLRGMTTVSPQPDALRQEVRDIILAGDPTLYDDFAIEALATLGPDIDDKVEAWLRQVGSDQPGALNVAVESFAVVASMSQTRPKLLLDLAEAYYIELPDPDDHWRGASLDDGIRDFKHGLGVGFGIPGAAWYYGPFFRLLNTIPREAIGFINRMLDHAARVRVEKTYDFIDKPQEAAEPAGVQLDIAGTGMRRYVGDSHVWAWYRGSSVGPYPCMSALLALERFIDYMLESLDMPARTILELLLRDCHNLAVPGLIVGFLTRHPDQTGDLLDAFLENPEIWHLETSRVVGEHFHVRDPDADKLAGRDRRSNTPHQTVAGMVVNARVSGDEKRLAQLVEVGTHLVDNAKATLTGVAGEAEYIAMIEGWAAGFRFNNYRASSTSDGVLIEFERPAEIEQILAPGNQELHAVNVMYALQNRYGRYNDDPENWPVEHLEEDLAVARRMDDEATAPKTFYGPENALVAVAAAAVHAHAMGLANIDLSNLAWAAGAVIWAGENPRVDEMDYSGSMFSMGADRAAAASVPLLLLAPFDDLGLDRQQIERCLRSLGTSVFDEVRANYVQGTRPVWTAPCDIDADTNSCRRHAPAWAAAAAGLIDCRLGPWNRDRQRREPDPLPPPLHESLPLVADDDLLVNRLRMPLACMIDARDVPCLQDEVARLWAPLWEAHRRGLAHWWKEGYDHHPHITHEPIARRMIEVALDADRDIIGSHIETFAANSKALHLLFDGFATVLTYDEGLQARISDFWPWALRIALDTIGDGTELRSQRHWFDYVAAALLPTPSPRSADPDIDGTLARCRVAWIQPASLGELPDRWLRFARGQPKAVDAVVKFAKGTTLEWQTTVALTWIETIIDGRFDLIANHLWHLEEWLTDIRSAGAIVGKVKSHYHRIVDGLAAAGDRGAVRLQQLDE